MTDITLQQLKAAIRDIPDFPKPGVVFKDITPILADAKLFHTAIECLSEKTAKVSPSKIVGIDARGFLFGAAVAYALGLGFIPVRKRGKLPYETVAFSYTLEYGDAAMEMHVDAVAPGEKIVLIDDLLATGGTSAAAVELIHKLGGSIVGAFFLIELEFLKGRQKLAHTPVESLIVV